LLSSFEEILNDINDEIEILYFDVLVDTDVAALFGTVFRFREIPKLMT